LMINLGVKKFVFEPTFMLLEVMLL